MGDIRKSVGIFLISPQKKILLHLRDNNPHIDYPDYWGLIGGKTEEGENSRKSIKREIKEELGLEFKVKNIKCVGKINLKKDNLILKDTILILFKGNIESQLDKINLKEGKRVSFFKIGKLTDLKMVPTFRKFILENKHELFN